jgi:hypothetical protein
MCTVLFPACTLPILSCAPLLQTCSSPPHVFASGSVLSPADAAIY